jgi:hypothetical protein
MKKVKNRKRRTGCAGSYFGCGGLCHQMTPSKSSIEYFDPSFTFSVLHKSPVSMAMANTSPQGGCPIAKPLRTSRQGSSSLFPFRDAYFPPENSLPFRFLDSSVSM